MLLSSEYERNIYKIDGNSGKTLLSPQMIEEEIKKNMGIQSSAPYRTHNGKTYTEEHRKAFEGQEYIANKKEKNFLDKLFGTIS